MVWSILLQECSVLELNLWNLTLTVALSCTETGHWLCGNPSEDVVGLPTAENENNSCYIFNVEQDEIWTTAVGIASITCLQLLCPDEIWSY